MKTAPPMAIASPAPQFGSTGHAVASGNWAVASTAQASKLDGLWRLLAMLYSLNASL